MKKFGFSVFLICVIALSAFSQTQGKFDRYFIDKTMRIDYFHLGDAKEEMATLDQVYEQGAWAGSLQNLIDPFDNGRYYTKIYDLASEELIFSKVFDSYFGEYKTTAKALDGEKRTYHETALVPYPKNKIKFVLEVRDKKMSSILFLARRSILPA